MKVSYKILKKYLPYIENSQQVADNLIMHTAEVEEIIPQAENLSKVFTGKVVDIKRHSDSDKLNICQVEVCGETKQIVCGAPNVGANMIVPVAVVGADLGGGFVIKKTKIRGETSEGMICSLDELGLIEERQEGIWEMPKDTPLGVSLRDYLEKNDEILEIDNKAINHRPDMFSYMGVLREISTINNKKIDLDYENIDFSKFKKLKAQNLIPEFVKRYSLLEIAGVSNKESRQDIKTIIEASGNSTKGLLVDVSNYSLYFYGQPAHIFDKDKIDGEVVVRFAKKDEEFVGLDDNKYILDENDIVIADNSKVLALGGIIGGKSSAVDNNTKNILIETACFDQAILRKTGKKLGIRTDSLNVFEKDIMPDMCHYATSLIVSELKKECPELEINGYFDSYEKKQEQAIIDYDLNFYNKLLGTNYSDEEVVNILENLGIKKDGTRLTIPFWRKELKFKADIAEEIARIKGYNNIESTIPKINLGAIVQDNIYDLKNKTKDFFTNNGFFEVYNYSFVNKELYENLKMDFSKCVDLKNYLSLEATHLRSSLIPNLMLGLKENIRDRKEIKLVEIEKVFLKNKQDVTEKYLLSGVITSDNSNPYYEIQSILVNFFQRINTSKFEFTKAKDFQGFEHKTRTANIIIRGENIGYIGEVHPLIGEKFSIKSRIGYFEIDAQKLANASFGKIKAKELSSFQENNFDLSFVIDKSIEGKDILKTIAGTDKETIKKVETFDIYEDNDKLKGKRSISFKIYIQSQKETLGDDFKNSLIQKIIKNVELKGGVLR